MYKDLISKETAKLLREKGHLLDVGRWYVDEDEYPHQVWGIEPFNGWKDNEYPAPDIYQLAKWLREEQGFDIEVLVQEDEVTGEKYYAAELYYPKYEDEEVNDDEYAFNTYEQALMWAVTEAVKDLR